MIRLQFAQHRSGSPVPGDPRGLRRRDSHRGTPATVALPERSVPGDPEEALPSSNTTPQDLSMRTLAWLATTF